MQGANPTADPDRETILVLLADGNRSVRHARVTSLLRQLGVTIEVDFGGGWIAGANREAKTVIAAHGDVMLAGGVYQRTDRTLPRRTRRLAHE